MRHLERALPLAVLMLSACGGGGDSTEAPAAPEPPRSPTVEFHPASATIPATGAAVPGVEVFDETLKAFMRKWNIPGLAVAVAKDGRLLLARGYGYADFEGQQAVRPDSMFRIASISKILTSIAILTLRDRGQLQLDQTFMSILTDYTIPANGDPRIRDITLRQLLNHAGGWDRDVIGNPFAWNDRVSQALGVSRPVSCAQIIRYMMGQPLQFTPGSRAQYSGLGFCILGEVVARVSGKSYERFVREEILAPLGVRAMATGSRHASDRGPTEVKYYPYSGQPLRDSPFPGEDKMPAPYTVDLWAQEAEGGWIGSATDLTRFIAALDPALRPNFLTADSLAQMTADPGVKVADAAYWYGFGLYVGPTSASYGHGGDLPGTRTTLRRDADGYTFAVLTNTRASEDYLGEMTQRVREAIASPAFAGATGDQYPDYPSPALPASRP